MRIVALLLLAVGPLSAQFPVTPPSAVGVRIRFGYEGKVADRWDGNVVAEGARITAVEPWRFDIGDQLLPGNAWRATLHIIRQFAGAARPQNNFSVANGVVVYLDSANEAAALAVHTSQGDVRVSLRDIPYGLAKPELNGRVLVDRVPGCRQLTESPDEQDYPAAATAKDGSVWIAYLEFKHSPNAVKLRLSIKNAPANFDAFAEKPGGDQIFARHFVNGTWEAPIAITAPGGDLWRPAIAVDGGGRPWIFWSANKAGDAGPANYDVFARTIANGAPGVQARLTSEPGSDIDPVAATDSNGRVWVAWQAWRSGHASILSATQQGDAFTKPAAVSTPAGTGNDWNPAIAADRTGRVTVAWDSYRNGNYDIYLRSATVPNAWGKEVAVAASPRYEAYPSLAYAPSGRLWVAYEEGAEGWGKDFGAYDTGGVALYQGRAIRLRGLEPDGRWVAPSVDPGTVLTGAVIPRTEKVGTQADLTEWLTPNPANARDRAPNQGATNMRAPRNTSPRVVVDGSGRVFLAYRTAHPAFWIPIGTVWTEYVVSWNGAAWTPPIYLHHSDNLLDNRPALVSAKPGELLVIGSSDHRRNLPPIADPRQQPAAYFNADHGPDMYNNDLFASTIALGPAMARPAVQAIAAAPAGATQPSATQSAAAREKQAIASMRAARTSAGLRVLRGEFHRHSEVSTDGGSDGTLFDQWRYALDAASLDWIGCCDHDNGNGREYTWWLTQKLTEIFYQPGSFVPMFSYERSVAYPEGHRNVIFAQRGIRTLPRLPKMDRDAEGHAPDTQMLYRYLKQFNGVVASHTSGTGMGTDWRDNDPAVEPIVEIYQGDRQNYEIPGGPRSNSAGDSIGGWEPKGFVSLALDKGYQFSFEASSDHVSTHLSYCNILAKDASRQSLLDAVKARHVYGATDNILADFRAGTHMMGDAFTATTSPEFRIKLQGTANFKKVYIVKNNKYVYTQEPNRATVEFTWRDNEVGKGTSFYYVRGEQADGNIVWVSPMWISY